MDDDERLTRLTELARETWPGADPLIVDTGKAAGVHERGGQERMLAMVLGHPRALDALEAALLVLSGDLELTGEERSLMRPDIQRIVEANAEVGMAYTQLLVDMEQLASEWDQQWLTEGNKVRQPAAWYAEELRARAKRP